MPRPTPLLPGLIRFEDTCNVYVFACGDCSVATIWQPYHLEWDHWTDSGALAAWQGVRRIADLRVNLLCPAHGPIVDRQPRTMLRRLGRKLLAFARVLNEVPNWPLPGGPT